LVFCYFTKIIFKKSLELLSKIQKLNRVSKTTTTKRKNIIFCFISSDPCSILRYIHNIKYKNNLSYYPVSICTSPTHSPSWTRMVKIANDSYVIIAFFHSYSIWIFWSKSCCIKNLIDHHLTNNPFCKQFQIKNLIDHHLTNNPFCKQFQMRAGKASGINQINAFFLKMYSRISTEWRNKDFSAVSSSFINIPPSKIETFQTKLHKLIYYYYYYYFFFS
jgi:hypothetical protein